MKIWVVWAKGLDWENVEAFLKAEDAEDYLKTEMQEQGVSGQIKSGDFNEMWPDK